MVFEFPGCGREINKAKGLTSAKASHSAWQDVLIGARASASMGDSRTGRMLEKLRERTESLAQRFCKGFNGVLKRAQLEMKGRFREPL